MKRLITILSLIVIMVSGLFGQTTITIGTGTTTGRYPLNDFYIYSRSQCLYLSSEIGMAGVINKLRWYRDDVGADPNAIGLTEIWLMETSNSVLTGTTWEGPGTLVASISNIDLGSGGSWFEIDITDFNYSGSQNLLVSVYTQNAPYVTPHSTWRYTSSTPNYLSRLGNSDGTNPPTMSLSYNRPNIQLEIVDLTDMVFTSATTITTSTNPVIAGSTNQPVIALQVVTTGSQNPFSVTSVDFTTSGTTSTLDLTAAKVFYTTSSSFSSATPFGSVINNPSGTLSFSGTQTLAGGNNYFWLCYDISGTATEWNVADGTCTQFTTSEPQTRTPTATDPAGSRTIRLPLAGTYTIDNTVPTGGTNYISFTDACNDLNNIGHSAAVTFNVTAGQSWSRTVPASPYNYAYLVMNYIGTAANPVIFQKYGAGANPLLNITGLSGTNDIGFFLYGCDYVTFNGIDISDAGTTSADYLEYGYYLQGPANNNCQYVTVQNCTIDLSNANTVARGIYCSSNAPTSAAGANHHNTFTGNTIQGTYNAIYLVGNSTYYDDYNEISGNVIQNLGSNLSTALYGIYGSYQTNLTIGENVISNVSGASSIYALYLLGTNNTGNIYMNDISAVTGTSTSSAVYGIYISSGSDYNFYQNQIYAIAGNATTAAFYISSATTTDIYRNSIYNISRSGTSSSYYVYGLYIGGGTTHNIYNNNFYDLRAPLALSTTTNASVRGMSLNGGTTLNVYYNTVYLDYVVDASATTNQSAALYMTTGPGTVDLRNNIFVNNTDLTAGGTRAVAFYKNSTSYTNISSNTNNNLYFCGTLDGTPTNLIFYDGTNPEQTLSGYKARVAPRDASAVTENPPFTSASDPYDLHLQSGISTQCESGGTTVSVVDDYDGDARYPNSGYPNDPSYPATAPDIGADEFAGQPLDLNAPNISYTVLANTSLFTNRVFSNVSITDPSGVNVTSGTNPRIYFKKSTNANILGATNDNTTDGWKWTQTGQSSSPFSFTIDYSLLNGGGPGVGEIIQYFVVAQDLVSPNPNVGINSGTFASQPASVALTAGAFPIGGTINSYSIVGSISGTFNVGTGQTYTSLTANAADGFFKAVNDKVVTGNIVVNIISDITETGAVALNQFAEEPAGSNFTITIQPDAAVASPLATVKTISGSYAGGLIRLNGADRVTFDGRVEGSGNYLTFSNSSTSTNSAVFHLISLGTGAGATNNTIRNCNISAGSNSVTSTFGIHVGGATISTSGTGSDNDNFSIIENEISKAYFAVYARGVTVTGLLNNLLISGNIIGSDLATDYITYRGVDIQSASAPEISQNIIFNLQLATAVNNAGIDMGQYVTDAMVSRNEIYGLRSTSTSGYGAYGINISTSTGTSNININNNLIYDLITDGDGASTIYSPVGIRITGGTNHKVYYNSVNLYGSFTNVTTADLSACFMITSSTVSSTDVRDNIFNNSMTGGTGTKCYAAYVVSGTTFGTIDYNNYYVSGPNGVFGYYGADVADLTAWRLASGQDVNSISSDPLYLASDDLKIPSSSPVVDAGIPVPAVDYDFDGLDRDDISPNMGAYESVLSLSCPWPVNLRDTLVTAYSAVLKWNPGGAETQWRVKWGETGFDPEIEGALSGLLYYDTLLLTSLNPATGYEWYVRAICSETDSSILVGPDNFQTLCGAIPNFPFTHNFDNQTIGGSTSACTGNTLAPLAFCWEQETVVDDINWNVATGATVSASTGPDFDHSTGTGKYLYTESSTCYGVEGWIYTPEFNFTGVFPVLSFWYHMYGATMGSLSLQGSTDGGTTWSSDLWSLSGDQGNQWYEANVVISQYANEPSVKFRFVGLTGTSFTSDMAIDDFMIDVINDPVFNITPTAKYYGECPLNNFSPEYYTQTFTVQNAGPGTLNISGCSLTGPDATQFVLTDNNTYPLGLSGSATITVSVKFDPNTVGAKTAALSFSTPVRADYDAQLTGMAVVYPPQNFTGETTATYTNQLDWDPPRPEGELRYDNGIATAFYGFSNATPSNYFFTRFTAPVSGNLDWIGVFCEANTVGTQWNQIMVCPEFGTSNQPDLTNPIVTYPDVTVNSTDGEWILLELTSAEALAAGEDFFVVTNWKTSTTGPWVGTDGTNNYGRCFWTSDGGGVWNDIENSYIMRAYMSTSRSSYLLAAGIPNPSLAFLPELSLDEPVEKTGREKLARVQVPGVYEPVSGRALLSYTVLKGAAANSLAELQAGITGTSYEDISVLPGTQYFYGILAEYSNSQFSDTTNIISLTTMALPAEPDTPHPADLATDVSPDDSLTWINHGNVVFVDLYYSQIQSAVQNKEPDAKVLDNVVVTNHYNPAGLMAEGMWYWQVVVKDGIANEAEGAIWSFTVADVVGPVIIPDPLPLKTASTDPKTITATITDLSGVPSLGTGLPVVYWKVNTIGTYSGVTANSPPENDVFIFSNVANTTLTAGDTVFYFFAAQDAASIPNVSVNPSAGAGGLTASPPSAATPPSSPYYFVIVEGLSGNYSVGNAELYTSLTGVTGFFNALNNGVITGEIHVQITSSTTETGTVALNGLNYANDSFFDVFFEVPASPGRAAVIISGNYAGGLIRLNGADHVTFDGGAAKELTIRNFSTAASSVFLLSNGASWNTIRNCNMGCGSNTATSYGVSFVAAAGNDRNTIEGNNIFRVNQGIALPGSSSTDGAYNLIKDNVIGSDIDSLWVYVYGIYATYQTNFEISGNEVKNVINSTSTPPVGISIANCNNTLISKNYIHDILYTGTGGYGAQGIYLNADEGVGIANPNILLSNNIIRHVAGDSDVPSTSQNYVPTGIRIVGAATITQGIHVYSNSVYLTNDALYGIGNNTFDATGTWCAALSVEAGPTGINVVNNAFYNNLGEKAGYSYTSYGIAIWAKAVTSPFGTIDHNIYYSGSCDVNSLGMAGVNTTVPILTKDLAQWQAFTGQDVNSLFMNPDFRNNILELTGGASHAPGSGAPLIGVPEDYSGDTRDAAYPTIGAHEYPWQIIWTANGISTNWFDANNWESLIIPGMNVEVTIPGIPEGGLIYPVIGNTLTGYCKNITVKTGATMTVEAGGTLNIREP